jgi:hypothetical protein
MTGSTPVSTTVTTEMLAAYVCQQMLLTNVNTDTIKLTKFFTDMIDAFGLKTTWEAVININYDDYYASNGSDEPATVYTKTLLLQSLSEGFVSTNPDVLDQLMKLGAITGSGKLFSSLIDLFNNTPTGQIQTLFPSLQATSVFTTTIAPTGMGAPVLTIGSNIDLGNIGNWNTYSLTLTISTETRIREIDVSGLLNAYYVAASSVYATASYTLSSSTYTVTLSGGFQKLLVGSVTNDIEYAITNTPPYTQVTNIAQAINGPSLLYTNSYNEFLTNVNSVTLNNIFKANYSWQLPFFNANFLSSLSTVYSAASTINAFSPITISNIQLFVGTQNFISPNYDIPSYNNLSVSGDVNVTSSYGPNYVFYNLSNQLGYSADDIIKTFPYISPVSPAYSRNNYLDFDYIAGFKGYISTNYTLTQRLGQLRTSGTGLTPVNYLLNKNDKAISIANILIGQPGDSINYLVTPLTQTPSTAVPPAFTNPSNTNLKQDGAIYTTFNLTSPSVTDLTTFSYNDFINVTDPSNSFLNPICGNYYVNSAFKVNSRGVAAPFTTAAVTTAPIFNKTNLNEIYKTLSAGDESLYFKIILNNLSNYTIGSFNSLMTEIDNLIDLSISSKITNPELSVLSLPTGSWSPQSAAGESFPITLLSLYHYWSLNNTKAQINLYNCLRTPSINQTMVSNAIKSLQSSNNAELIFGSNQKVGTNATSVMKDNLIALDPHLPAGLISNGAIGGVVAGQSTTTFTSAIILSFIYSNQQSNTDPSGNSNQSKFYDILDNASTDNGFNLITNAMKVQSSYLDVVLFEDLVMLYANKNPTTVANNFINAGAPVIAMPTTVGGLALLNPFKTWFYTFSKKISFLKYLPPTVIPFLLTWTISKYQVNKFTGVIDTEATKTLLYSASEFKYGFSLSDAQYEDLLSSAGWTFSEN